MHIQPYLFFDGRCDEALEFYGKTLDAKVIRLMRHKDAPQPPPPGTLPPGAEEKVMHASFRIGESTLFASDGHCQGKAKFEGFSLSIAVADEAEGKRLFDALADGGQVTMPFQKTFFSPGFGMTADKFGVLWMIIVESKS